LWIKGQNSPLPNVVTTDITYNLTYGIGWAHGHVAYAPVSFADIKIPKQALLDVDSALNPALSFASGILGLGFTSLSTIDALVNRTKDDAGRSVLYNAFKDNPSEPNFISFVLERADNSTDDVEGSFTIGEYEDKYKSIADTPKIPTWPVNSPTRWNVLLDAVLVGSSTHEVSTHVVGAPSNRAVALLDSGTSFTYASVEICNAIYGGVEGAKYSDALGQWVVPCDAEIDMALQFGGRVFPIHPLDVTPKSDGDKSTCLGSFIPQSVAVGAGQFDVLIGDNVLRSVYSVYDFGDFDSNNVMGDPYVQLLPIITADGASAEFAKARGTTPRSGITFNALNNTVNAGDSTSVTLSTDVAKVLDTLGKYLPALAGVIALNAIVLLALFFLAIFFLCKRRREHGGKARPRSTLGRSTPRALTPMPMDDVADFRRPQPSHTYEPVSMALSEAETILVPPSPGFTKGKMTDRPYSYAGSSRMSNAYGPEDEPFTPPPASRPSGPNQGEQHNSAAV